MKKCSVPCSCLLKIGNKLRYQILKMLEKKPMTVNEICEETGEEQSLVSHSLIQLKRCCFVSFRKKGKQREYYLNAKLLGEGNFFENIEKHTQNKCAKYLQ